MYIFIIYVCTVSVPVISPLAFVSNEVLYYTRIYCFHVKSLGPAAYLCKKYMGLLLVFYYRYCVIII